MKVCLNHIVEATLNFTSCINLYWNLAKIFQDEFNEMVSFQILSFILAYKF